MPIRLLEPLWIEGAKTLHCESATRITPPIEWEIERTPQGAQHGHVRHGELEVSVLKPEETLEKLHLALHAGYSEHSLDEGAYGLISKKPRLRPGDIVRVNTQQ